MGALPYCVQPKAVPILLGGGLREITLIYSKKILIVVPMHVATLFQPLLPYCLQPNAVPILWGGVKRNHPDLSTTTNNGKKGEGFFMWKSDLFVAPSCYVWRGLGGKRNEVIKEGQTFRKADFQVTSKAPKAVQVFWPTPSFSADETLKRIGKKWSCTGGQTFRKADFQAKSEAQAVPVCVLTYSKFLSKWDLN